MNIQPKPGDIDLLGRLIDMRDSAHLAGHTDDVFRLFEFNGTKSVLFSPGRGDGIDVSTLGMRRLQDLGLFNVVDMLPKGFTFDLVDDVRDRLDEMKVAVGQPSRLGEAQEATERAETTANRAEEAQRDLEASVRRSAEARAALREAFAARVGRWVRWMAVVALGLVYLAVVVVAGYFLSSNLPLALVAGAVVVALGLALLDWLLHIDGFALAARAETAAAARVRHWLESFDGDA